MDRARVKYANLMDMRHLTFLAALLCAVPARALEGLPAFGFTGASPLRVSAAAAPAVVGRPADVVSRRHMFARAGREALFGYADTPEQYAEAVGHWSAVLRAAGVTPGTAELKDGMYVLPYRDPAGRVIRDFLADPKQFPPKDDAGLRADMARTVQALMDAGLRPVSSRVLDLEYLLPTYSLLYLTARDENPAREARARVLNTREDADFGVFRAAGLRVVSTPKPWLMVYVGPEAGFVAMGAKDEDAARKKLAERRAHLAGQGKTVLEGRVEPTGQADVPFLVSLYFLH